MNKVLIFLLLLTNTIVFAKDLPSDSLHSLCVVVDGIMDFLPEERLKIEVMSETSYKDKDVNKRALFQKFVPITDYTMEVIIDSIPAGKYYVSAGIADEEGAIWLESHQFGLSRTNDAILTLRYNKKNDWVRINYPPFDQMCFSIPETKVMRIILSNPTEAVDLTTEE